MSYKTKVNASARVPEKEEACACIDEIRGTFDSVEMYPAVPRPIILDVS
jgi:hypothetical protein